MAYIPFTFIVQVAPNWYLFPHRGATNIWNTCTKICASETCSLTPFFGFLLNIQSTSKLELKQMVSTLFTIPQS